MESNFNDVGQSYRQTGQAPLDAKYMVNQISDLTNLGANNNKAFTYFKGLEIYCHEDDQYYKWTDNLIEGVEKLLPEDFVYPVGSIYDGIDYSGRAFNFIKRLSNEEILEVVSEDIFNYTLTDKNSSEGQETLIAVQENSGQNKNFKLKRLDIENKGTSGTGLLSIIGDGSKVVIRSKKVSTDNLDLIVTDDEVKFNLPSTFTGTDYYVNLNYTGTEELGTPAKPFKSLTKCIDKILNRGSQNSPSVNSGNVYKKWENRGGNRVRVVIQSYCVAEEQIAINGVEYFLERGGYASMIEVLSTGPGAAINYLFNLKDLIDSIIADGGLVGGKLPYHIECKLFGKGVIAFAEGHTNRKGLVRTLGYSDGTSDEQFDSVFTLGTSDSSLSYIQYKNPSLSYIPLYSDGSTEGGSIPISREGVNMTGLKDTNNLNGSTNAVIFVEGKNSIFRESLQIEGNINLTAHEQNFILIEEEAAAYGTSGEITFSRSLQHVNFSSVELIETNPYVSNILKFYKPSKKISDIYLKQGGSFSWAGKITTQANTAANQGGQEAIITTEKLTDDSTYASIILSNSISIYSLYYNHYIKQILHNGLSDFNGNNIALNNANFDSYLFEEAVSLVDQLGADTTIITRPLSTKNTYFRNTLVGDQYTKPFSNADINSVFQLFGTIIQFYKGFILPYNFPIYANDAAAAAENYPLNGVYIVTSTGMLKVRQI